MVSTRIPIWRKPRRARPRRAPRWRGARPGAWAPEADLAAERVMISTAMAAGSAGLARLDADRDVLAATATVREHSLRLVRARTDHGLDSDTDLAQAEAGPPAARADLAATDEALALVLNRLAALLGAGPAAGTRGDGMSDDAGEVDSVFTQAAVDAAEELRRRVVTIVVEVLNPEGRSEEHTSELQSLMRH